MICWVLGEADGWEGGRERGLWWGGGWEGGGADTSCFLPNNYCLIFMLCLQFYVALYFLCWCDFTRSIYIFNFYWSYILMFLMSGHVFKRKTKQHSNGINKYYKNNWYKLD